MSDISQITFQGRMSDVAKLHTFPNGGKEASVTIINNRQWKNKETGAFDEKSIGLKIKATGYLADKLMEYPKGTSLLVTGSIDVDIWDKENGEKGSMTYIVIDTLQPGTSYHAYIKMKEELASLKAAINLSSPPAPTTAEDYSAVRG